MPDPESVESGKSLSPDFFLFLFRANGFIIPALYGELFQFLCAGRDLGGGNYRLSLICHSASSDGNFAGGPG
ncbi:MAG: hypothetical protein NUV68_08480 [Caldiserica bacterium]|nr:hypothetical protein [Caldisericota bacterium]